MSKNIDQIHSKKQLTKLVTQCQITNQLLDTMKQISYCVNYFHVLLKAINESYNKLKNENINILAKVFHMKKGGGMYRFGPYPPWLHL